MNRTLSLIIAMLFLLLMSACSEQQPEVQTEEKHPVSNEEKVIIPESVEGKWKSVKIALHDQQEGTENIYRVDIGGSFQISGSNLRVTIENFIPAFSVNNNGQPLFRINRPIQRYLSLSAMVNRKFIVAGYLLSTQSDINLKIPVINLFFSIIRLKGKKELTIAAG